MSRRLTSARWGSNGRVLAPRWSISVTLQRNPELISRHCEPVACDVRSRALLYDVDEADRVLRSVGRWPAARRKS